MTMTMTTHTDTVGDDQARIELLAQAAEAASEQTHAAVKELETPGARRRATKLARQQHAASRLLARGAKLQVPACAKRLELLSKRSGPGPHDTTAAIDGDIHAWRGLLVSLHEWRGHTANLPATDE
jgi:hypothetical protein